jgi:WD40 repeat protein
VRRRVGALLACLALVSLGLPSSVLSADDGWSISASSDQVSASFLSTSASDARLNLENNVSFEPFGLDAANEILDALGFGGGYSQEATWKAGAGPTARCPELFVDFPFTCSSDDHGNGTVLIPDGLRAELNLTAPVSAGFTTLLVVPDQTSRDYDGAVAAIGIALEALNPGPIGSSANQVAALALQLLPEAAGFGAAIGRGDSAAAFGELMSLSKRALKIIEDHAVQWGVGAITNFIPGAIEIRIGLACAKAIVALVNLDAHLLTGHAVTTMTVAYGGEGGATVTAPPLVTPTPETAVTHRPAPKSGSLIPTGSMTVARYRPTATLLSDGQVLIAGGRSNSADTNSADLYDPAAGVFTPTGSMTGARDGATATLLPDGRVLVAGGWNGGTPLRSAEIYDPATGRFTVTGSMSVTHASFTATALPDGRVLVAGGYGGGASAELYDPNSGTFSPTGFMSTPRSYHTATLLSDGRVLIAGGFDSSNNSLATAERYDPATGMFTPTGSMAHARESHRATLLTNGQVLVEAGWDGSNVLSSAELYDPTTGTFSTTGPLTNARFSADALRLTNGQVLVAGGSNNTLELYDPSGGSFSVVASMATRRVDDTATLLPDGSVLIAGGNDENNHDLSSAELWQP